MKRFGPLDVAAGTVVVNLIYATLFEPQEGPRVRDTLAEDNPGMKLEVRKAS